MNSYEKINEAYHKSIRLTESFKNEDSYKILKAKITGKMDGKTLDQPYRAIMYFKKGHWSIAIEQAFDGKFNEYSGLPGWALNSWANKKAPKEIYIDAGQKWSVTGFDGAVKEAFQNI